MTLTHFHDDERKANPRAAMVRVEIRDAQGYAKGSRPCLIRTSRPSSMRSPRKGPIRGRGS